METSSLPSSPEEWNQTNEGSSYFFLFRETDYDTDDDYEVYLAQFVGIGWHRLAQTVALDHTNLALSARLKLSTVADNQAWTAAALELAYLDEAQTVLGETRIASWTRYCPWESSDSLHLVEGVDDWADYSVSLQEEWTHLPAVSPPDVRYLRISLLTVADVC